MASAPWQYGVTQPFGVSGEHGTDYATPFHTPVPAPFAGTVVGESYGPYGGEVDIATSVPGNPKIKIETLLHLDEILVAKGAHVDAGQVAGLSGGQLSGGMHPASAPWSTGPHTEIDFWTGSPWASSSINPDPILQSLLGAAKVSAPTQPGLYGAATMNATDLWHLLAGPNPPSIIEVITGPNPGQAVAAGLPAVGDALGINAAVTSIGHGLADFLAVGTQDVGLFLKRQIIALAVAAVVLLILFA